MKKQKPYYKCKLPHIQPVGATFFVTFRLFGSIPKVKIDQLKLEYGTKLNKLNKITNLQIQRKEIAKLRVRYFVKFDQLLDKIASGPHYLQKPSIARIIQEQLHRFDKELYNLISYTIMSNHVHILIDTSCQIPSNIEDMDEIKNYSNLDIIMKRLKGATASFSNKALSRSGRFWEKESYDIYIRNEKMLDDVANYILYNPVKAKLVDKWNDFPWNFIKEDY